MIQRQIQRLVVYAALAAYGAIALCGQGLHELLDCHHHGFGCDHRHLVADNGDAADALFVSAAAAIQSVDDDSCIDDDDCAICQFHAQGQLHSVEVSQISGVTLVAQLTCTYTAAVDSHSLQAFDSRGPPAAATTL